MFRSRPLLKMPRNSYWDRIVRPLPSDKRQEQKILSAYSEAHLLIEEKETKRDAGN